MRSADAGKAKDVKAMVAKGFTLGLLAGAIALAAPGKAEAQVSFGVRVGPVAGYVGPVYRRPVYAAPVYGGYYGPGFYGPHFDHDAWIRHEEFDRRREFDRHDFDRRDDRRFDRR